MKPKDFNTDLLDFIRTSPTPFHAVRSMRAVLVEAGYTELRETEEWKVSLPGKYFTTRNGSSLIAFRAPDAASFKRGIRMVGAHTDSPCLRVKPEPELDGATLIKFGVEIYGGVLLSTWFDRDLSLAGRVSFRNPKGRIESALVDFKRPLAVIPNLAIHLNREVNDKRTINRQTEMPPVLSHISGYPPGGIRDLLEEELTRTGSAPESVLGFELSFYDTQPPARTGLNGEFLSSARLDNLLSCWVGLRALIDASPDQAALLVCNDHEEVGSVSAPGANGPMLLSVLRRMIPEENALWATIARSVLISADNAHALHPNYMERHDPGHAPILNAGPVLKINSTQRYATTSETEAMFEALCHDEDVAVQRFVARSDMGCGSTIGPITASVVGVRTVDVGIPTFAMHSIRELAGASDPERMYRVMKRFFGSAELV